jgi:hypothetical protein
MFVYMTMLMAGFSVTRFDFKFFSLRYVPLCVFGFSLCAIGRLEAEYAERSVFSA